MCVDVVAVQLDRLLVVLYGVFVLLQIVVSGRKVEMALWTVVVDLECLVVVFNGFVEEVQHVKRVAKVVIGWSVPGVKLNG